MNICQRPDRDAPGIVCGHPLPCPHHTVILDKNEVGEAQVRIPASAVPHVRPKALDALKTISRAIHESEQGG